MKDHMQTIINVCFAISITVFVYQNNTQQDRIKALENTKTVDSEWQLSEEKFKELIFDLSVLQGTVANNQKKEEAEKNITYKTMLAIDENINNLVEGVNRNRSNLIKAEKNQNTLIDAINNLQDPKSTNDIKTIIRGCEVETYSTSGPSIVNMHGHTAIKC